MLKLKKEIVTEKVYLAIAILINIAYTSVLL